MWIQKNQEIYEERERERERERSDVSKICKSHLYINIWNNHQVVFLRLFYKNMRFYLYIYVN